MTRLLKSHEVQLIKFYLEGMATDDPQRLQMEDEIIRSAKTHMHSDAAELFGFMASVKRSWAVERGLDILQGKV